MQPKPDICVSPAEAEIGLLFSASAECAARVEIASTGSATEQAASPQDFPPESPLSASNEQQAGASADGEEISWSETEAEIAAALAQEAATDPGLYVAAGMTVDALEQPEYFPEPAWAQPPMLALMQEVITHGLAEPTLRGCLIQIAPEHFKTEQIYQRVCYEIGHNNWPVLIVSANVAKAAETLSKVRSRLMSSFQRLAFPDLPRPSIDGDARSGRTWTGQKLCFEGIATPAAERRGLFDSADGDRARLIVLDDCFSADGAVSPVKRANQKGKVLKTWMQRIGATGKAVVANNNWHPADGFHHLRGTGSFAVFWASVSPDCHSMQISVSCATSWYPPDIPGVRVLHHNPGQWVFETPILPNWSEEKYKQQLKMLGRTEFDRVYRGLDPAPEHSLFGLRSSWGWRKRLEIPAIHRIVGFHDPAQGTATGCFSATALIGLGVDGCKYLLAAQCLRTDWEGQARTIETMWDWAQQFEPAAGMEIFVEDNANQWDSLSPEIRTVQERRRKASAQAKDGRSHTIHVTPRPTITNKDDRIRTLGGPLRGKELLLLDMGDGPGGDAAINEEAICEMEDYPKAREVDGPDAIASAYGIMAGPSSERKVFNLPAKADAAQAKGAGASADSPGAMRWAMSVSLGLVSGSRGLVAAAGIWGKAKQCRIVSEAHATGSAAAQAKRFLEMAGKHKGLETFVCPSGEGGFEESAYEFDLAGMPGVQGWADPIGINAILEMLAAGTLIVSEEAAPRLAAALRDFQRAPETRAAAVHGDQGAMVWGGDALFVRALGNIAVWARDEMATLQTAVRKSSLDQMIEAHDKAMSEENRESDMM